MNDDLVAQLRDSVEEWDGCAGLLATLAADRIEELEEALQFYAARCLGEHPVTDDLVRRLRLRIDNEHQTADVDALSAADRIEELERHVELRDFFLTENNLWEKFAEGAREKQNDR
jgi:hypothetical protein